MKTLNCERIVEMLNRESESFGHADCKKNWNVSCVCTDSRTAKQGCLFVPIKGEYFDGHDYIDQAFAAGATAALCAMDYDGPCPVVHVPDTRQALKRLARSYREDRNIISVAVTGSAGKTTTKELTAAALSTSYITHKNEGNKNNDIGLPCAVLELDDFHEAAVFEMGMSGLGEISELSIIAQPDIAVITNIGSSHIGLLGSKENILKAKLEIIDGLKKNGKLILNADDAFLKGFDKIRGHDVIYYGIENSNAQVFARDIKSNPNGSVFTAIYPGGSIDVKTAMAGRHNVYNCLAALTAALYASVDMADAVRGIKHVLPGNMRQEIYVFDGITIIEDCYNANPDSVKAALGVLCGFSTRRVALLGDMLELGELSSEEHFNTGKEAAACLDVLIAIGNFAQDVAKGAKEAGMPKENIYLPKKEETCTLLSHVLKKSDTLLVKGSRGMRLEDILKSWKSTFKTK